MDVEELAAHTYVDWRKILISNNVGVVKPVSSTLQHGLEEERHFALVEGLRFSTWARC